MRRLLFLVSAIVLVDMVFYAAITPLLPVYADRFDLSKTGAGVLAGSYAAGALIGSVPSGWLVLRFGARVTVLVGLVLFSVSSLGFAFGERIEVLDGMRFLQGVGGACTWAGGLGWLISLTPPSQRGTRIGSAMSVAVVGLLLGPLLGAVARGVGSEVPFTCVAVAGVVLMVLSFGVAAPGVVAGDRPLAGAFREPLVVAGIALVAVAALVFGVIGVLVPLELDRLGAGGAAIGAVFLIAAGIEAVCQTLVGRAVDRRGRAGAVRASLLGAVVFLLVLGLPQVAWLLGVVVVFGCVVVGVLNTPAMALITDGIDRAGLDQGFGFALVNLVWATGQVCGSMAGGTFARVTSDGVAYVLLAGVCGVALVGVVRSGRVAPAGRPA
jgi:MFS family permease